MPGRVDVNECIVIVTVHITYARAGSNGTVTFVDVPPRDENNRVYNLRVVGKTADGVRTVIRRRVRVGETMLIVLVRIIL